MFVRGKIYGPSKEMEQRVAADSRAVTPSAPLSVGAIAGLAITGIGTLVLGGLICGKVGAFNKIPNNLHYLGILACAAGAAKGVIAYQAYQKRKALFLASREKEQLDETYRKTARLMFEKRGFVSPALDRMAV